MAVTVTDVIEDGIPYRITEDLETGLYIKEGIQEIPLPDPQPTPEQNRITQLEQQLAQTNADLAAVLEMILT